MITALEQMWHSLDNLMMWVPIIPNETDITIIIIMMMVMILMGEVARSAILFHSGVFKYWGLSVNFYWSTDKDNKAEISKKKNKQDILRLRSPKTKK